MILSPSLGSEKQFVFQSFAVPFSYPVRLVIGRQQVQSEDSCNAPTHILDEIRVG